MRGTNNLQKNIFLAQFQIAQNFHYFCKVRACRISVKNSIFQKLPKIVENTSFDEGNKKFAKKYFLKHIFRQHKIFTIFVRSAPVEFRSKIQFSKNCLKLWRNTSFDKGTNNLQKIFSQHFLRQHKIFTFFVRSAPVEFPSKIQFSKNCLKLWRNTSFDEGNK